ncbi:MAG: hypothetical protein MAGBODY4_01309 [Candidatus Marinimicrobia bacterium]|nr:hypothetical protein [Candidatus Neomarinimicrobiota bacterium]
MPEPIFWGQTAIFPENSDTTVSEFISFGTGLEVGIKTGRQGFIVGNTIHLQLLYEGKPVSGTLAIMPVEHKTTYLTVSQNRQAGFSLRQPGMYLITASHNGKNCSTTFNVRQTGK